MLSLRDSVKYPEKDISMKELAEKLGLPAKISLRTLIAPESFIANIEDLSAGDVHGWAKLTIFSNGIWLYSGHVTDDGILFGDKYSVTIWFEYSNESGQIVAKQDGEVEDDKMDDWNFGGRDPWIYANWENIRASGFAYQYNLHTDWDIDWWDDVFKWPVKVLGYVAAVAAFILLGHALKDGDCYPYFDGTTAGLKCKLPN